MRYNVPLRVRLQTGFTLIEMIIGIVVFSISLGIITQLILPTEQNSADQIHQVKASELAQALMNDILTRSFDENSDRDGGLLRCDEDQNQNTVVDSQERCSDVLGPDAGELNRSQFDDIDDFNGYNQQINALLNPLDNSYQTFTINVRVFYDGPGLLFTGQDRVAKRIEITVTTPLGTNITFTTFKANY